MAIIRREIKFWENGRSDHYGLELDIQDDLGLVLTPGNQITEIERAARIVDALLSKLVYESRNPDAVPTQEPEPQADVPPRPGSIFDPMSQSYQTATAETPLEPERVERELDRIDNAFLLGRFPEKEE